METVEIKIYEDVLNRSMNYKCRCESYVLYSQNGVFIHCIM